METLDRQKFLLANMAKLRFFERNRSTEMLHDIFAEETDKVRTGRFSLWRLTSKIKNFDVVVSQLGQDDSYIVFAHRGLTEIRWSMTAAQFDELGGTKNIIKVYDKESQSSFYTFTLNALNKTTMDSLERIYIEQIYGG